MNLRERITQRIIDRFCLTVKNKLKEAAEAAANDIVALELQETIEKVTQFDKLSGRLAVEEKCKLYPSSNYCIDCKQYVEKDNHCIVKGIISKPLRRGESGSSDLN